MLSTMKAATHEDATRFAPSLLRRALAMVKSFTIGNSAKKKSENNHFANFLELLKTSEIAFLDFVFTGWTGLALSSHSENFARAAYFPYIFFT